MQEAYVRAFKAFARFRGGDGKAWFMTILRNVCYTMIKKVRAHETPEPFDEEIHCATADESQDDAAQKGERGEPATVRWGKLSEEFREIIVLHDLEGFAYKEIAVIAGNTDRHGDVAARAGEGTAARGTRGGECEGETVL